LTILNVSKTPEAAERTIPAAATRNISVANDHGRSSKFRPWRRSGLATAIAFGALVVLTMFASEAFDPRIIW